MFLNDAYVVYLGFLLQDVNRFASPSLAVIEYHLLRADYNLVIVEKDEFMLLDIIYSMATYCYDVLFFYIAKPYRLAVFN